MLIDSLNIRIHKQIENITNKKLNPEKDTDFKVLLNHYYKLSDHLLELLQEFLNDMEFHHSFLDNDYLSKTYLNTRSFKLVEA